MVISETDEMVGVECQVCHEEAFHLSKREVTIVADCCPRCTRRIDAEEEESRYLQQIGGLSKAERRLAFQEKSYDWARSLHGKQVVVLWHQRDGYGSESEYESHVRGIAYRITDECGGWGNVKVVIAPEEHYRLDLEWTYSIEYGTGKHLPYQKPIIDRQKYGLYLNLAGDGSVYTMVSWGSRACLVLDEE